MCRLWYTSNIKIVKSKISFGNLCEWLKELEEHNGGHGNGIGGFTKRNKVFVRKGVRYLVYDAAFDIWTMRWAPKPIVFHTRLASAGGVKNELCHPFVDKWENLLLIHNGHWHFSEKALQELAEYDREFTKYIKKQNKATVSDTFVLTHWLGMKSVEEGSVEKAIEKHFNTIAFAGNVIAIDMQGNTYIVVGGRDNEFAILGNELVFASEGVRRYLKVKTKSLKKGLIKRYVDGEIKIKGEETKTPTPHYKVRYRYVNNRWIPMYLWHDLQHNSFI